jgi:predicted nucleic acid-binding protein
MREATCDTSFWINADRCGLLPYVFQRWTIWVAPQISAEMNELYPSGQEFRRRVRSRQVGERAPAALHIQEFNLGERAAISLALEHPDWLFLIDDYRPHLVAGRLGLTVISTPTLVLALYTEGTITAEAALVFLGRLAAMGTVSPHLFVASLAQLPALSTGTNGD